MEDDSVTRFGLDHGFLSPEFEREQQETTACLKVAVMKEEWALDSPMWLARKVAKTNMPRADWSKI